MSIPQERLESIPSYMRDRYYSGEKSAYLKMVGKFSTLVSYLFEDSLKSYPPFMVLGSGSGAESFSMVRNLLEVYKRPNKIINIDINRLALARIKDKAAEFGLPRVGENLVSADVHALPFMGETKNEGFGLVLLSSVLHEIQSFEGWKSTATVFREAERVLMHGGFLVVREFLPPKPKPCAIEFKTAWAKNFFNKFVDNFRKNYQMEWLTEWDWKTMNGRMIATGSRFAWEIFLHARMFKRECEQFGEDQAFASFASWRELEERYTLATQASKPLSIAHHLVASSGHPPGKWAFFSRVVPDNVDDRFLNEHFAYFEHGSSGGRRFEPVPIKTKRMWLFLHKHPENLTQPQQLSHRRRRVGEMIDSFIKASFDEVRLEATFHKNGFLNW